MKKITLAVCIILSTTLAAQDSTIIFIEAGRDVSEVLTPEKIYQLPQFVNGKIIFRNGSFSDAKLNYNFLNGEIEFIGPANDTLAIAKNQMLNIKEVLIDNKSFFYSDGYLELVEQTAFGKLLKKQMFVIIKREKIGAYGQPTSTSAIESYGSFTDNYGSFTPNLRVKENITLTLRSNYFIGDKFNLFLPASKKNIRKLYPLKKAQIEEYLNKNIVDFNNGESLKKLFEAL